MSEVTTLYGCIRKDQSTGEYLDVESLSLERSDCVEKMRRQKYRSNAWDKANPVVRVQEYQLIEVHKEKGP